MKKLNFKKLMIIFISTAIIICLFSTIILLNSVSSTDITDYTQGSAKTSIKASLNSVSNTDNTIVDTNNVKKLESLGYKSFYENKALCIYTVTEGDNLGTFAIENKLDGSVWYSNPPDSSADSISINIPEMMSLLSVTYYDGENDVIKTVNSKLGSVDNGGLSIQALKQGLRFTFSFSEIKITIPLTILLNDDGSVTSKIEVDKIKEEGNSKVFSVKMLPYFCAASSSDNGYILLPDGSGAIMKLNNGKTAYAMYSQPVYGGDASNILDLKIENDEQIYMPLFGMLKNKSAVLAVIVNGAPQSTISAIVSGIDSNYNTVCNEFSLRQISSYSLDQGWQGKKTFNVYQKSAPKIAALENRYIFLDNKNANLSGMAKAYRGYLEQSKQMKDVVQKPSVYLDFLGAVSKKKSILGFIGTTKLSATSFDEALNITRSLKNSGVDNLNIRYLNWDEKSIDKKIVSKAVPENILGGKNDFNKLLEYTKTNNIGFFPDIDLVHFAKPDFLFQEYFDASRNLNNQINKYYWYKLNLYNKDTNKGYEYILNFNKLIKTVDSFMTSYNKLRVEGLSLSAVGNLVTSDYSNKKDVVEAWSGVVKYQNIIKNIGAQKNILLDSPNSSVALYAKHIVNMPEGDSEFDMLDYHIPFYQMVISGTVSYSGSAINLNANTRVAFLKALETGSNLHYTLSSNSKSGIVKNTQYDYLIAADYKQWTETINSQYKEMNEVYKNLGSQKLISYEMLQNNVVKSGFLGGGELIVNYNSYSVTIDNKEIKPFDYITKKGGPVIE